MSTISKQTNNLSYFKLALKKHLQDTYNPLAEDQQFLTERSDRAAEAYSEAKKQGLDDVQASELANKVLFEGLYFSKIDTLVHIIWEEFSDQLPEDKAPETAIQIAPKCEEIFSRYNTKEENFNYSPEYLKLYTELTGAIQLWLENDL